MEDAKRRSFRPLLRLKRFSIERRLVLDISLDKCRLPERSVSGLFVFCCFILLF